MKLKNILPFTISPAGSGPVFRHRDDRGWIVLSFCEKNTIERYREQVNHDVTGVRRFSGWTYSRPRRTKAFISAAADSALTFFKGFLKKSASLTSLLEWKTGNGVL